MAKLKMVENGNLNVLMPKLMRLRAYDMNIEKNRRTWGWTAGISFALGFIGLLVAGFSAEAGVSTLIFVVPGVFGAVSLIALIVYLVYMMRDLDNRKLDAATKLVEMIGQDVPPARSMALFIDFGNYNKAGKLLSKEGGWTSVREMTYEHPWFKFSGALYDGNRFELEVTQCVKRKEKPKRKYTKVKEKIVEKAVLSLKLNPRLYPAPTQVAEQVTTGHLPHGINVSRALGRERVLKIAATTPAAVIVTGRYGKTGDESNLFDGNKLLGLIIDAYAGLQKSRPAEGAAQA